MNPDTPKFFDLHRLRFAWQAVRRKKSRGGIDGVTINEFERNADRNLAALHEELKSNKYVPEPYERIYYQSPGSNTRALGLPTVKDKIVQMAVRNTIEDFFNSSFKDCSYAYRPGKGHRKAIRRVEHHLGTGNVWVTTCDIDKFFDSLDHEILMHKITSKVKDEQILRLIRLWLKIGIVHHEKYKETNKGVPQGGVISPLLSNIYLHDFDVYLTKRRYNLVRYADDFIILQKKQNLVEKAHDEARIYLETDLKLELNEIKKKTWHVKSGFVFLGLEFKGFRRTISDKKYKKAELKIAHIEKMAKKKTLGDCITEFKDAITSWRFYYGTGDTGKQFAALDLLICRSLARIVAEKLSQKEIPSKAEAEKELNILGSLSAQSYTQKNKNIKAILSGKILETAVTAELKTTGKPVVSQQQNPDAKTATEKKGAEKPVDIRRQIAGKKKTYQRRRAMTSELIITRPYCKIGKMYQRIVVRDFKGKILRQVPHMALKHILVMTKKISLSADVIHLCSRERIALDFIDFRGQPVARLSHPDFPVTKVGLAQIEAFNNGRAKTLTRAFVEAKIRNQLSLIKYFHKYRKEVDTAFHQLFITEDERIERYLEELETLSPDLELDDLRGQLFAIEGRSASSYWLLVRELIKDEVEFKKREHTGASDLFNSLLNYGYGILYSRIWGSVLRAGLNPMISFLHVGGRGKGSLVFDLIEEFRAHAVDRVLISMIGRNENLEMAGKLLSDRTRKKVVQNILERLHMPFRFRGREKTLIDIMNLQAKAVANYLTGRKKSYKPFIAKW